MAKFLKKMKTPCGYAATAAITILVKKLRSCAQCADMTGGISDWRKKIIDYNDKNS